MKTNVLCKTLGLCFLTITTLFTVPLTMEAHIPTIADDKHNAIDNSLLLQDIIISRAIYQRLSEENPFSYISFIGAKGQPLDIEIGVPKITELGSFRPEITLFHVPSRDNMKLTAKNPIEIFLLSTSESIPTLFHEPFTDTHSWILGRKVMTLPFDGEYYLRSSHSNYKNGKMWVAIGSEERFAPEDWGSLPASIVEVRRFHESEKTIALRHTITFVSGGVITFACALIPLYLFRNKTKRFSKLIWQRLNKSNQEHV